MTLLLPPPPSGAAGWRAGFALCLLCLLASQPLAGTARAAAAKPADYEGDEAATAFDPASPGLDWWRESMQSRDARLQWWREARFGLFVHWGIYSGLGGVWHDQKITTGYTEHIQRRLKIPIAAYRAEAAGSFNPAAFDAREWIRLAQAAGAGYFVITAKHHDGFAMYDSAASDYNIVRATPFKRDPMRELRDACRAAGLKFGFYYSHAFDWGEADAPGNDWDYQNPGGDTLIGGREWWLTTPDFLPRARRYVDTKALPQLRELIANYDPDLLWFDTPHKLPPEENLRILQAVRAASPRLVVNGRLLRGMGDYDSTTDKPAEFPPHARDWEAIPTTNESYGWSPFDHSHKPASHFVGLLTKATARGGNTLLNIGPMGDGRIDPKDVAILEGIGRWWATNAEAIHGAKRTPLAVQAWGESTRKGRTLYLHVFAWPADGKLVVGGLKSEVRRAYLLADPKRTALPVARLNPLDVVLTVPAVAPDPVNSVIAVECAEDPVTDSTRLLSPTVAENWLRAFDATLQGRVLRFGAGKAGNAYVENWTKPDESVNWMVRTNTPGVFSLTLVYDATAGDNSYRVSLGAQTFAGPVLPGKAQAITLGLVELSAGTHLLTVAPHTLMTGELMRLRGVRLQPVVK
ncbi:MAG: alpha-L-fucosidase [Opitutae bacterium]|nr:alpha-L-fucosidase [Opitutae bacterium]